MNGLFYSRGSAAIVGPFPMTDKPRIWTRPAQFRSDDPRWRTLPVEGTAAYRRMIAADRRARRVKLLLILVAALVGGAVAILKG